MMYRVAMKFWNLDSHSLFLAIPDSVYEGFFQETLAQLVIVELQFKLLVFDPEKELITQWLR